MLKSVRDLSLQTLFMNTEMNPLSGDGNMGQPINNLPSESTLQSNEFNPQMNEQMQPFQDIQSPLDSAEPSFQGNELNQQVNEQTPQGDLSQMQPFQDNQPPLGDAEPAFQIDEQMPSVNPMPAQNNSDQLQQFDVSEGQSQSEIQDIPDKKTENILVERTLAEEEEFHKKQEDLFQQMSKNFALGKDQDAIQMREQLKQNVGEEYSRLAALLEYIPPKLPELQENIRDEMKGLEKSLEDNNREGFSDIAEKLWGFRDEMQEVSKMVAEKRKFTTEKIEDFKKRYGNLVPGSPA